MNNLSKYLVKTNFLLESLFKKNVMYYKTCLNSPKVRENEKISMLK